MGVRCCSAPSRASFNIFISRATRALTLSFGACSHQPSCTPEKQLPMFHTWLGCVIYLYLDADRTRPKSPPHSHSFNSPQAQTCVHTHTGTLTRTGHRGTRSQTCTGCSEHPPLRWRTPHVDKSFWLSSLASAAQGVGTSSGLHLSHMPDAHRPSVPAQPTPLPRDHLPTASQTRRLCTPADSLNSPVPGGSPPASLHNLANFSTCSGL